MIEVLYFNRKEHFPFSKGFMHQGWWCASSMATSHFTQQPRHFCVKALNGLVSNPCIH